MIHGWGDGHGLFSHPARAGLVMVMALAALALLFVPFDFFATGEKEIRRQRSATFLALLAVCVAFWFLPYADKRGIFVFAESSAIRYTGLVLVLVGTVTRLGAMVQLGPLFSGFVAIQKGHQVVNSGFYRWVRHPIYAASLLALAGVFLIFRSQTIIVGFPCYLVGVLWRMADEERLLVEEFGDQYRRYQQKTWRLVPLIY
jgi:protein-S-isoprenylcysteine O-methyltransferase Ste14